MYEPFMSKNFWVISNARLMGGHLLHNLPSVHWSAADNIFMMYKQFFLRLMCWISFEEDHLKIYEIVESLEKFTWITFYPRRKLFYVHCTLAQKDWKRIKFKPLLCHILIIQYSLTNEENFKIDIWTLLAETACV